MNRDDGGHGASANVGATRNELAQARTSLADDRTVLASERSLLAWYRTAFGPTRCRLASAVYSPH